MQVPPAVAAGHPDTAAAGLEILAEGGSAVDAAVGATLAACVAETLMTGLAGGGHAIMWDAASRQAHTLDFFTAVPGLGAPPREAKLVDLAVDFGNQLVHYAIGPASCGVPAVPFGCEALWRRGGRLPWRRIVEPAVRLARAGSRVTPAHADCLVFLEPVMTLNEGAGIYKPGGRLLGAGDMLRQPGLERALDLLISEGADTFRHGTIGRQLIKLLDERGGLITATDLAEYEPRWSVPAAKAAYAGTHVAARADLTGVVATLERLPPLAGLGPGARALQLVEALNGPGTDGHTTNVTATDRDGNACVVTTSLGLGSGDFLPGLDIHLNSMLGEADLLRGPLRPGERMGSMMAPLVATDAGGLVLAGGAAGGTRIRSALVQVLSSVLEEGLDAGEAVARPRLHPVADPAGDGPGIVHCEPDLEDEAVQTLRAAGYDVRRWNASMHYFGGVSVVGRRGAAADPRRNGAAMLLNPGVSRNPSVS